MVVPAPRVPVLTLPPRPRSRATAAGVLPRSFCLSSCWRALLTCLPARTHTSSSHGVPPHRGNNYARRPFVPVSASVDPPVRLYLERSSTGGGAPATSGTVSAAAAAVPDAPSRPAPQAPGRRRSRGPAAWHARFLPLPLASHCTTSCCHELPCDRETRAAAAELAAAAAAAAAGRCVGDGE